MELCSEQYTLEVLIKKMIFLVKNVNLGCRCNSVMECLPNMCKVLTGFHSQNCSPTPRKRINSVTAEIYVFFTCNYLKKNLLII
jgi:hypothetical protein